MANKGSFRDALNNSLLPSVNPITRDINGDYSQFGITAPRVSLIDILVHGLA